jgi:hypothetical protein
MMATAPRYDFVGLNWYIVKFLDFSSIFKTREHTEQESSMTDVTSVLFISRIPSPVALTMASLSVHILKNMIPLPWCNSLHEFLFPRSKEIFSNVVKQITGIGFYNVDTDAVVPHNSHRYDLIGMEKAE